MMKSAIFIALCIQLALAYHDPDLNYHLSQIQQVSNCNHGYSYAAPSVQLTTTGIKAAAAPAPALLPQQIIQAPAYQYSGQAGYSTGITYQAEAPKITYAAPAVTQYQTSFQNYATAQQNARKEVHGYATTAGLSSAASNGKTVTPLATYANAPIIAKVTSAPLIAKFALSSPKLSYASQNLIQQQAAYSGSYAKASLNFNTVHSGGPVVSQVYSAPPAGYATSASLKVPQASQYAAPVQYSSIAAPAVTQYHQVAHVSPAVSQYTTSSVSHGSSAATSSQYFSPSVTQHAGASIAQYSAPIVTQHTGSPTVHYAAPVVQQYSAPAVIQHSAPAVAHYAAPAVAHYAAPAVAQYSAPAVAHYSAPAVASVTHYASAPGSVAHVSAPTVAAVAPVAKIAATPLAAKNVHREFLENYDAHPRYAYEYSVNDPHTGDVKQQKEERDGEVVKGQYSLVEPDGSVRTVNYVADWETGFHADVRNSKDNQH